MIIKLRYTPEGWIAFSPQLMVTGEDGQVGSGTTPTDALLAFFVQNAERLRPVQSCHFDMAHSGTAHYVTTHSISNTKLI